MRRSFGPGEGAGTFFRERLGGLNQLYRSACILWGGGKGNGRIVNLSRFSGLPVYGLDCYCLWHLVFNRSESDDVLESLIAFQKRGET
jgi:hypothetical protein